MLVAKILASAAAKVNRGREVELQATLQERFAVAGVVPGSEAAVLATGEIEGFYGT